MRSQENFISSNAIDELEKEVSKLNEEDKRSRQGIDLLNNYIWAVGINQLILIDTCEEVLHNAQEIQYASGIAHATRNLAYIHLWMGGGPRKSAELASESIHLFQQLGNRLSEATAWDILAISYTQLGVLNKGLEYTITSMDMFELVGDKRGVAWGYFNLGLIYDQVGDLEKSTENYELSLKRFQQIEYRNGIMGVSFQLALSYKQKGCFDASIKLFESCLKMAEKNGEIVSIVALDGLLNIAEVYLLKGALNTSQKILNKVLESFPKFWKDDSRQKAEFQLKISLIKAVY